MSDEKIVITYKWPWTMMPLESVGKWIEAVKDGLQSNDSIYGKNIFVAARREDANMLLIENDTDETYAIVKYERVAHQKLRCTVIETISTRQELSNKLTLYNVEAIAKATNSG